MRSILKSESEPMRHIFRPHRLNAVHRCGLLLYMSPVPWSMCLCVVCLSVCLRDGHTGELCNTAAV